MRQMVRFIPGHGPIIAEGAGIESGLGAPRLTPVLLADGVYEVLWDPDSSEMISFHLDDEETANRSRKWHSENEGHAFFSRMEMTTAILHSSAMPQVSVAAVGEIHIKTWDAEGVSYLIRFYHTQQCHRFDWMEQIT